MDGDDTPSQFDQDEEEEEEIEEDKDSISRKPTSKKLKPAQFQYWSDACEVSNE